MDSHNDMIIVNSIDEKTSIVTRNDVFVPISSNDVINLSVYEGNVEVDTYTAGEPISGGRVIAVVNGLAYHADITNPSHKDLIVGMSKQACAKDANFEVITSGKFYYYGLGLQPNVIYTCDNIGRLTDTAPIDAKFWQIIGNGINEDTININLSFTIKKA